MRTSVHFLKLAFPLPYRDVFRVFNVSKRTADIRATAHIKLPCNPFKSHWGLFPKEPRNNLLARILLFQPLFFPEIQPNNRTSLPEQPNGFAFIMHSSRLAGHRFPVQFFKTRIQFIAQFRFKLIGSETPAPLQMSIPFRAGRSVNRIAFLGYTLLQRPQILLPSRMAMHPPRLLLHNPSEFQPGWIAASRPSQIPAARPFEILQTWPAGPAR
ncbi:hypothetical protein PDESU_02004 [Pontiella desulfatans]|uniref:Uncharacterized protein n=1 Tax=Pontiella desulfatans TaxID=2750659 RepID=A0A6C2U0P6_PONDE|nr:hypothetical protein PDESU_02004 [Pontiella desulfatans]